MIRFKKIYFIGISLYFIHLVISSTNDIITKYLASTVDIHHVVFFRFLFATLSLLPFMIRDRKSFVTNRIGVHALRGLLLYGGIALWVLGLQHIQVSTAVVINFTIPIFVLLLAFMFLNEKVGMHRWLATFIAFVGIIVVNHPSSESFNSYGLILILASLLFACLDVINKYFVVKETLLGMLFYSNIFTVLFSSIATLSNFTIPSTHDIMLLMALGIGANLLLYFLLKSFEKIEVSSVAPIRYLELIISSLFGYVIFNEIPQSSTLVGALIIIPSTLFVVLYDAKKTR